MCAVLAQRYARKTAKQRAEAEALVAMTMARDRAHNKES